jgi:biopolymer transport protein ExbD
MATDPSPQEENAPLSAINVTPFVDVVLVLLVIFMVTAPVLMKDILGIQLPKASSSDAKAIETLGIAITRQGQWLLNGKLVSAAELATEAGRASKTNPEAQAIISADKEALHGDVVKAIDVIKTAGMNKFAIQIEHQP